MTNKKQLKDRIRARMAATGESYSTARRHVLGLRPDDVPAPARDAGYRLRGGQHPDSAVVTNLLAHHGVRLAATGAAPGEALVLGVGGGLGAGYALWAHAPGGTPTPVLGFRNGWHYTGRWIRTALHRWGVPFDEQATSMARRAADRLSAALDVGEPAIVWPDRFRIGYRHLPPHLDGHGGHPVVAYGTTGDRVRLDDRNLAPLTVPRERLDVARARVASYKNLLLVPRPDADREVSDGQLRAAVRAGLVDCAEQLRHTSESFSVPAWRAWSRLMTDRRDARGWPRLFADRRGVTGALLAAWEGIEPAGTSGGNLRRLYADFLTEAAALLDAPALGDVAGAFAVAARGWHEVAEAAFPAGVPALARLRELTAQVNGGIIADGDAGTAEVGSAAGRLWALRDRCDESPPLAAADLAELFAATGERLREVYHLEAAAVRRLHAAVADLPPA
ncbi:BtrH N-terminal domain-containing protein [Micromonospora zhanjiangensis]|uniref:BtrH N-terminal domain-containing protein n=1 Tax=Micromonospora zhanjiangensis TaxID=1522057 RepID=A0ABV8KHK5_9ACTN